MHIERFLSLAGPQISCQTSPKELAQWDTEEFTVPFKAMHSNDDIPDPPIGINYPKNR